MTKYKFTLFILLLFCNVTVLVTSAKAEHIYKIYLDADLTHSKSAGHAIRQGITVALAEIDNKINNYSFELILKDHQGNTLRSKGNLDDFLADTQALVIFSGLHSPPLLANKSFINNNQILLLDPWAAAGPITRTNDSNNWIFRLSIDDIKAGYIISKHAIKEGFTKPYLLLEDTGWGRSNEQTMTTALKTKNTPPVGIEWFNWGIGRNHARLLLRNILTSGADVIFFVGNAPEGKTFAQALIELPEKLRLPIRSHWGITGGDFAQVINKTLRKSIDLQFVQTNFSFLQQPLAEFSKRVLLKTIASVPEINNVYDIHAQTGFVHGYDLTRLLIAAIKQAGLSGNNKEDRLAIKNALEHLEKNVQGLLKRYRRPFSPYSPKSPDAHEALEFADYTMGYYGEKNEVILLPLVND